MEGFIFCTFSSPTGWLDKQTNNDWAEVGEGGHSTRRISRSTHGCDAVCCMNSFLLGIEAIVCLLTAFHDVRVSSQWKMAPQAWGFPGQWTYQASEHPVSYQEPWFEKDVWIYYLWTYLVLFAFKLYRIQMNCVEVCRSVGILFCLLKTKLKSKCRNAISDFKNRNRVIEMKNSMSMMWAGVFTFVTFCVCVFINKGVSMCVGVLVCAWMYNLNYRYRDKI